MNSSQTNVWSSEDETRSGKDNKAAAARIVAFVFQAKITA